jgi:sulfite exporter TauE/SafE/copper chaperone CopZ
MTTYTLHVTGTHCASCKVLIEDILSEQPEVSRVTVDLSKRTVQVEGTFPDDPETLSDKWTKVLSSHRYILSTEKQFSANEHAATLLAIPIGIIVLVLFYLLQRSGFLNIGFEGSMTPLSALLIGVIASLSTCLAVVGGLVLSLSAKISQEVFTARPFLFFHTGRLAGFALLGGMLGLIGETLAISPQVTMGLGILAALVMVILGLNLLGVFHITKRFQFVLPRHMFDRLTQIENGFLAPFIVGVGTFFLPCGFTQAMQINALSSGSFGAGMTVMGMFALGTLPMLMLLSFGSFRFAHTRFASLFFKTAGVVVIGFGLFALLSSLTILGIIQPLLNI